jgi:peptidoglycan hydrolase CwlO-like protein
MICKHSYNDIREEWESEDKDIKETQSINRQNKPKKHKNLKEKLKKLQEKVREIEEQLEREFGLWKVIATKGLTP